MLNQFAVEILTLQVDQRHSHLIRYLKGCWGILSYRRAAKKGRQAFWTHMVYRETILQIHMRHLQHLIRRNSIHGIHKSRSRFIHPQWRKVKDQNKIKIWDASLDRQPKIQSSSVEQTLWRNFGADQQRLQIFWSPLWQVPYTSDICLLEDKGSRPRYVFVRNFLRKRCKWIKEVEMVDSVDALRSSLSVRCISMPNFQVLDARIASALNKIIHNSHFKRRISLEEQKAQKQDRFLRGRQIAYLIYDYFWVLGIHDSVENYADLFTISLRNDDIQEFDSKWDGILLSMTKIPPDDILEVLYKLRIRESEKLKTVLELYDLEIHQKKNRTWLSQFEDDGEKKYRARFTK